MSTVPSRFARARVRQVAPTPAVAGFRPGAIALAAAFALAGAHAQQSDPAGAVHGTATFARNGNNLLVTTTNGAGNRSVINWNSFGVAAGSTTRFQQPDAASTSINRVTGNTRSDIFGTLSSNGKLVLVNPSGIAIGANAVVDTGGFTASTMNLSEADAIAGRMLFQGGSSTLSVGEGARILAHGGDIVLVGSQVQVERNAVVQTDGGVIVAAGEKVEITGRGLEGIRLEVRTGNEAVNLGTLKGDAVGIFAGTLKHSGLAQAQAVSAGGGKVVLQALAGDNLVDGSVVASAAGGKGGSIDVLGNRVALLAGANIDASGANGGGSVRIGGDYQGKNPNVPNAKAVYVDAAAKIKADATVQGNGGRVIIWADEVTRMRGAVSARGGATGGDGGFAEISGKGQLDYTGLADLRAPLGKAGTLLLDPQDITIFHTGTAPTPTAAPYANDYIAIGNVSGGADFTYTGGSSFIEDAKIEQQLRTSSLTITTSHDPARYPAPAPSAAPIADSGTGGQITMNGDAVISWGNANTLEMLADKGIDINGSIDGANATLALRAAGGGISQGTGSVITAGSLVLNANGNVTVAGNNVVGTLSGNSNLNGSANGDFTFRNGRDLAIGAVSGYGNSFSGVTAGAGDVDIRTTTAGTSITVVAPPASTLPPVPRADGVVGKKVTLIAEKDVNVNGNVTASALATIQAKLGQVNQLTAGSVRGGSISMQAGSDIVLQGGLYSRGGITVTSDNGGINFASIYANGDPAAPGTANGGDVTLQAKGNITGGSIFAQGAYYGGSVGDVSGRGGHVSVTSNNGSIDLSEIQAHSGSYNSDYSAVPPGTAGTVTLKTASLSGGTGDITVRSDIHVSGGNAAGSDAPTPGGAVIVDAKNGSVSLYGDVYATGGSYMGSGAVDGATGGQVTIAATGDITLAEVSAGGGSTNGGVGGRGGGIHVTAGGNVLGAIYPDCLSCTPVFILTAEGGAGGTNASTGNGNRGGRGGDIDITRKGGDLLAGAGFNVDVSGGAGGTANFDSSSYVGGQGGDGGTVTFSSTTGKVTLASPTVAAVGGNGGANADDSTSAASGAFGTFRAAGTSVDVTSNLNLAADWVNDAVVTVAGSNQAFIAGSFQNNNQVLLSDSASIFSGNDFVNAGRLAALAGAAASAGAVGTGAQMINSSTGVVDVAAGGALSTFGFLSNDGTVHVDGELDIFPVPPTTLVAAAPSGTVFTNLATGLVSGTGTIAVDSGTGSVDNFGTIAPAGAGAIGTLMLDGNLVMESGSALAVDLVNTASVDKLVVTGGATTGGNVAVTYLSGAAPATGDQFHVLQAGTLDATTLPTVNKTELQPQATPTELLLVAVAAPSPAPSSQGETPQQANALQQANNDVVTFADLFVKMSQDQEPKRIGKDDIVVTDTACTR